VCLLLNTTDLNRLIRNYCSGFTVSRFFVENFSVRIQSPQIFISIFVSGLPVRCFIVLLLNEESSRLISLLADKEINSLPYFCTSLILAGEEPKVNLFLLVSLTVPRKCQEFTLK